MGYKQRNSVFRYLPAVANLAYKGYQGYKKGKQLVERLPQRKKYAPAPVGTKTKTTVYKKKNYAPSRPLPSYKKKGQSAKYDGLFNQNTKRAKSKPYNEIIEKFETGSILATTASNHSVVCGHTVAIAKIQMQMIRCLVKTLVEKAGVQISNFNDKIFYQVNNQVNGTSMITIRFAYLDSDSATAPTQPAVFDSQNFATNNDYTWQDMCNELITYFSTNITGTIANYGNKRLVQASLFFDDANGITLSSSIPLEHFMLNIQVLSTLSVQNRTANDSGTTSTDTNDQNPLHGKLYKSRSKWRNGFSFKRTPLLIEGSRVRLCGYPSNGTIIATSQDSYEQIIRKPPSSNVFEDKVSHSNVVLQPGAVKKDLLAFSCKISFNGLFQKLEKYFDLTPASYGSSPKEVPLGFASMLILEQMIHDRSGVSTVNIAWELNQTYKITGTVKRTKCLPIITIQA